jgi:hypothetical protein
LGKGKPRGLGVLAPANVVLKLWKPEERYDVLQPIVEKDTAKSHQSFITAFQNWCKQHSGKEFDQLDHIRDFLQLHRWPARQSVRYYPLNFSNYTWLPAEDQDPDEPKSGNRPPAMKLARDL